MCSVVHLKYVKIWLAEVFYKIITFHQLMKQWDEVLQRYTWAVFVGIKMFRFWRIWRAATARRTSFYAVHRLSSTKSTHTYWRQIGPLPPTTNSLPISWMRQSKSWRKRQRKKKKRSEVKGNKRDKNYTKRLKQRWFHLFDITVFVLDHLLCKDWPIHIARTNESPV